MSNLFSAAGDALMAVGGVVLFFVAAWIAGLLLAVCGVRLDRE